jgi:3-methyladenine DNA glycosylase AlkD
MTTEVVLNRLKALASPDWAVNSMARFGIVVDKAFGIPVPKIRSLAKEIGKDHVLALALWGLEVHEARILATMIDDPKQVTEQQMESWVKDIDSWDVCDHACGNLFDKTAFAYDKVVDWSEREEEYVKRAAFSLMAYLAVHDKKTPDEPFVDFLSVIKRQSSDDRNFVKKAVNWALREIGKRNALLHGEAVAAAKEIALTDTKAGRWIAKDALRELTDEKVIKRFK